VEQEYPGMCTKLGIRTLGSAAWRSLLTLAAISLVACVGSRAADATVLTFDNVPAGFVGTTYIEQGYKFFSPEGDLYGWGLGSPFSGDPSPTSSVLAYVNDFTSVTMTRVNGGAFNMDSIDLSFFNNEDNGFQYLFVFNFTDGTSISRFLGLDEEFGLETFHLGYHNLSSVTFGPDPGNDPFGLQWDNVRLSETPLPAALPLFASALGGLGFVGWRRKRADTLTPQWRTACPPHATFSPPHAR
jgi:hypothetical protein